MQRLHFFVKEFGSIVSYYGKICHGHLNKKYIRTAEGDLSTKLVQKLNFLKSPLSNDFKNSVSITSDNDIAECITVIPNFLTVNNFV